MHEGHYVFAQVMRHLPLTPFPKPAPSMSWIAAVLLTGFYSRQGFNRPLRRIKFNDPQTGKRLVFLTNNFALDALTIAKLYKCRWQVELFFKWIKQHLRIMAFSLDLPRFRGEVRSWDQGIWFDGILSSSFE